PGLIALALARPALADNLLPADKAIAEVVDHYIDAQHKEQNVKPAPLADDATLLRRLTLDLAGRIPTAAELKAYTSSTDPDKKTKLVDRRRASPAYVRHTVNELDTLLAPASPGRRGRGGSNLRGYLSVAVKENRGWDKVFRDLITASDPEALRLG